MATSRQRGFTLVEVVVAFVLLSLVLATGFEVFTTGMRRAIDLEERSQALAVAQSRLAVAGYETGLKEGTTAGEEGRYRWTVTIARSEEGAPAADSPLATPYGLYRIEATVTWRGADDRDHVFTLATLELGSVL